MDNNKIYWKGIEELTNDLDFVKKAQHEFPEYLSAKEKAGKEDNKDGGHNRRDFLKILGFSMAAASLSACETPVKKAIPYLNKPEEIEPGIANFYASTYALDGEYCSILVKTREGRPIKIEGNKLSSVTLGGTSARTQASLLNLYDTARLQNFVANGKTITHEEADKKIIEKLQAVAQSGKSIIILTHTILSPSTKSVIQDFVKKYPTAQHITYDAKSAYGILKANEQSFGQYALPSYDFSKAETIVGIGADFLGTWLSSIEYARQYGKTRKLGKNKKKMSRHYQFETRLSLTGANADYRTAIKPSQEGNIAMALYNEVAKLLGATPLSSAGNPVKYVAEAAKDLVAAKGKSLVVCGSNDAHVQVIINGLNSLLNNYGNTIDWNHPSYLKQGNDENMATFVNNMKGGNVGAVIFYGVNPAYDYPQHKEFKDNLGKVGLKISLADRTDETASLCDFTCPDHHYLEAWNDAEPKKGHYSLAQPTISPLFKTRAAQESLLAWAGQKQDFYEYIKKYWKKNIHTGLGGFEDFWTKTLHDGVYEGKNTHFFSEPTASADTTKTEIRTVFLAKEFNGDINTAVATINKNYKDGGNSLEVELYEKVSVGTGFYANNPWLQELPDPISKACWDNYASISSSMAKDKGLTQGDVVRITAAGKSIELPVLIQPGQAKESISIAIGYGREKAGKCGDGVGANVYTFAHWLDGAVCYHAHEVKIEKTGEKREIAQTQTHHTIMARPIVQEARLKEYQKNPAAGRYFPKVSTSEGVKNATDITLWKGHTYPNHSWGMVIDLNSCIGCGACVIGCQVENNVAVVGKQEVLNRREMHWIRIDRYYSSDAAKDDTKGLEEASENPEVVFQPMTCQHCNNAPCETVCPVAATTHSSEGLNQMAYNRCIGTRYCANNCPYKVRRFNWFNYTNEERFKDVNFTMQSDLGRMVLNPDVTVRTRGIMEKCTMCVQRIQEGKLNAKKDKRKVKDGEIQVACAQACPTDAIIFGDMNDPESQIAQLIQAEHDERAYHVLEEINTRPQVSYLTKIKNKE